MSLPRFKKVFLITIAHADAHYKGGDTPETGIGYIAESLIKAGLDYDVLDMTLGHTFEDLKTKIAKSKPNLIGISMKTYRYKDTYKLINKIRDTFSIPIVIGGPHISIFQKKALEDCRGIDFGITMEGEETIVELCKGKELDNIKGLLHRKGKLVKYNGNRQPIINLDEIPFPKYEKFELEKYWYPSIYIVSSRGCPSQCTFCSVRLAMGEGWRCRSAENILEELNYWYAKGRRHFEFVDDNFTLWKERAMKVCQGIKDSNIKAFFNCPNGVRADKVDKELLGLMKEVGWDAVTIGVEVGTNKMLDDIKKGETMEVIEKAIQASIDVGLEVHLNFIIGFPRQTIEDVEAEFEIALKYPIRWANFNNLLPYPGTELYEEALRENWLVTKMEEYLNAVGTKAAKGKTVDPVLQTPELSFEERKRLLAKAEKVQKEIVKRYHVRRLKQSGKVGKIIGAAYEKKIIPKSVFNFGLAQAKKLKKK